MLPGWILAAQATVSWLLTLHATFCSCFLIYVQVRVEGNVARQRIPSSLRILSMTNTLTFPAAASFLILAALAALALAASSLVSCAPGDLHSGSGAEDFCLTFVLLALMVVGVVGADGSSNSPSNADLGVGAMLGAVAKQDSLEPRGLKMRSEFFFYMQPIVCQI